jgi:hypothetical protein
MLLAPPAHQHSPSLLILEFGLTAIAFASAFTWPDAGSSWLRKAELAFSRLAHRRLLAVVVVGLSVLLVRLAMLPIYPVPLPFVPNDFSFLLASDTFAHGRLANPTPAMWMHFETIHVSMQPTYMTMYFPGQGLLLAAGQFVAGNPWVGVLISSALMCAAICWALQAWLPPEWALLGGFIAVLRLGLFSYWTNTYHGGGSLAALAGALVLGAMPRLIRSGRFRYSLVIGIGIAILAITRPLEGFLLCCPVAVMLFYRLRKQGTRPGTAQLARWLAAPLLCTVAAGAWMAWYDYRAFGNPLTPPYSVNRATYAIAPYFVWQQQRPEPNYRYREMRDFYRTDELDTYKKLHSLRGFLPQTLLKVALFFEFYAGFALLVPLLMVRRVFLDRRIRFLLISVIVLAAGMGMEIYLLPHYVAPFTVAFYVIGLQAMRHLRLWKPEGKPAGLALARFAVVVCVLMAGVRLFAQPLHFAPSQLPASNWNFSWIGPEHFGTKRAQVESQLEGLPGLQLAIVRYGSQHEPFNEWVYNSADVDASKVVWARDMDDAGNRELLRYYSGRKVWLVEPDQTPVRISPYLETSPDAGTKIAAGKLSRPFGDRQ